MVSALLESNLPGDRGWLLSGAVILKGSDDGANTLWQGTANFPSQ
jgi:hypothetical protein